LIFIATDQPVRTAKTRPFLCLRQKTSARVASRRVSTLQSIRSDPISPEIGQIFKFTTLREHLGRFVPPSIGSASAQLEFQEARKE
jgi:hypothetical protein